MLTRDQVLLGASGLVIALAYEKGPHHVATSKGAALYHLPIGSVIISHPGMTPGWIPAASWKKGEADWIAKGEAIWKANEWKGHGSRIVYAAGGHAYQVPGDARVWVMKDVDLSDPHAVANAAKYVTVGEPGYNTGKAQDRTGSIGLISAAGELTGADKGSAATPYTHGTQQSLDLDWKEVPAGDMKLPVTANGKLAAWVPSDWKIYAHTADPDDHGKIAEDPDGKWYTINGMHGLTGPVGDDMAADLQKLIKNFGYELETKAHVTGEPDHTPPAPGAPEGPAKATVNVGGVDVTKDDLHSAIEILHNDKSTAVKQPLVKKGHPLAAMDYHGVAKTELAAHPELKVPKGSKKEHVGQVKLAVLHHLTTQAGKLHQDAAQAQVAGHAAAKVQADAEHAQALTPGTHEFPKLGAEGSIHATTDEIKAAIGYLEAAKSTAIKQVLAGKKDVGPLGGIDYWQVVKDYQDAHADAHGLKAKPAFIAALQEAMNAKPETPEPVAEPQAPEPDDDWVSALDGGLGPEPVKEAPAPEAAPASGSEPAVKPETAGPPPEPPVAGKPVLGAVHQLHALVSNGKLLTENDTQWGTISHALLLASQTHASKYVYLMSTGKWGLSLSPPGAANAMYFTVTPQHKVYSTAPTHPTFALSDSAVLKAAHHYIEIPAVTEPQAPEPEPEDKWLESSEYQQLHSIISAADPQAVVKLPLGDVQAALSRAMVMSDLTGQPRYMRFDSDSHAWEILPHQPPGGVPGSPAFTWYEALPDHRVILHSVTGKATDLQPEGLISMIKLHLPPFAPGVPAAPVPEPEPVFNPLHGPGMEIKVFGKLSGYAPEGSEVYTSASALTDDGVQYAKWPDGTWHKYMGELAPPDFSEGQEAPYAQGQADAGQLVTLAQKKASVAGEKAELLSKPVPVVHGNVVVAEAPPGSKIYQSKGYGSYLLVKQPDGDWYQAWNGTYKKTASNYDAQVTAGSLKPVEPPTDAELEKILKIGELHAALTTSALNPAVPESWQKSLAYIMLLRGWNTHGSPSKGEVYVVSKNDAWHGTAYKPAAGIAYVEVNLDTMEGVNHTLSGDTDLSFDDIRTAFMSSTVANSVEIDGKPVSFGYYYKTKGKTYIEIGPALTTHKYQVKAYGQAAKATYTYHGTDGLVKTIPPTQAAKFLESSPAYFPDPKPEGEPAAKPVQVSYAAIAGPGSSYSMWTHPGQVTHGSVVIHQDGSGAIIGKSGHENAITEHAVGTLLAEGDTILDQYGTTVVKPGVTPAAYKLFGGEGKKSKADIATLLAALEASYGNPAAISMILKDELPGLNDKESPQYAYLQAFWADKLGGSINATGQTDAVMGLLRELLAVPEAKQAAAATPVVQFLKGLPPGINSPEDVFTFLPNGQVKPFNGTIGDKHGGVLTTAYMSKPELVGQVKDISAQFGDGKVVGTHISSLSKDQLVKWLDAWTKGDMKTVFSLDAAGGKVSPVHPGAPDSTGTAAIIWAPWGTGEVPAVETIPGDWTDFTKITLPKAEIDNYIIKAGLQHAEHLTWGQKRAWVTYHRKHDQAMVDQLSKQAHESWLGHGPVYTSVPVWTDDIKPANAYDLYLEDKTPAGSWPSSALSSFAQDHATDQDFLDSLEAHNQEFGTSYMAETFPAHSYKYYASLVIQRYLDAKHQKEIAEKSIPVWSITPGGAKPKSTHPIYEITKLIPLTNEKSQWFFKPAPGGKNFLAEQEDTAAQLGRLWGFKTPPSELLEFNGSYGQAQAKLNPVGDLQYGAKLGFYDKPPVPWHDLTQREVSDIAREHLLDWALDNNDGRASNFLRMPDGSIVGIDKGRAWASFGSWPGLSGTKAADGQSAQVATALYDAIRNHTISKDVADQAYTDVINRARRMQSLSDDRMRQVLEQAFAHRTSFAGKYGSKDKLVQAVLDRKNSLADDFETLWGKVYADAGYGPLPEVAAERLSTLRDGTQLHSGFTEPAFMDHVVASRSFGTAAFFGGHELEGSHFLVWREFAGENTEQIKGEATAQHGAYEKLVSWATSHQTASVVNNPAAGSIDLGSVKDEFFWNHAIIQAAKTISYHASDKNYNTSVLQVLANAKQSMEERLNLAEAALADPDKAGTHFVNTLKFGDPAANVAATKFYLAQVAKVLEGKDNGTMFQPGDLPRWEPTVPGMPEAPKTAQELKVVLKPASRPLSDLHDIQGYAHVFDDAGELHTGMAISQSSGNAWHVELPTGEVIEIYNGEQHGIVRAHQQRIRFTAVTADGAASLERIRAQLQEMGLDMREAEDSDLELHYWRHLAEVLADRKDSTSGKYGKVWNTLKSEMSAKGLSWQGSLAANIRSLAEAGLEPEDELSMLRAAWSNVTSAQQVQEFTDAKGWMPQLDHFDLHNPEARQGKPYWLRFDATPEFLTKQRFLTHSYASNPETSSVRIVRSGGAFSTEARLRALGSAVTGMSSSTDMEQGSSGYFFTRLNQGISSAHVLFSPRVLARTTTYGYDGDKFGNSKYKSTQAFFDLEKAAAWTASDNETMVPDTISLLDEIEAVRAYTEEQRQLIISELHALGITKIRGVPVEERIVTQFTQAAVKQLTSVFATDSDNILW